MSIITAWIERNVIAGDPNPEYSRLDHQDGPGVSGGCYHGRHNLCDTHEASATCGCGCHK